jgi:[ribosomal protein S18]-alanine N-acetyltransferase
VNAAREERLPQGVLVRRMRPGDLDAVCRIEEATFTMAWRRRTFEGLLRRDDSELLVAEREGEVVGYSICWAVADQAELGNLAVAEEARGLGVGRHLLEAVLAGMRTRGAAELFLEVRASNLEAQRLYRRYGFEEVDRRARYYTQPVEDALVLRLPLHAPVDASGGLPRVVAEPNET